MCYHHRIREILPTLIKKHFTAELLTSDVKCVIGYGSGVFPQLAKPTQNTVDLIMIVKNANSFHHKLMQVHSSDYAGLSRIVGASYVNIVNKLVFPIHFNHIETEGTKIKYSIVDQSVVLHDLKTWNLLTIAGRLHKPVFYNVTATKDEDSLRNMMQLNHRLALNVAILSLIGKLPVNNQISVEQLYNIIANISYAGDIRHTLAVENKYKVDNIVRHNIQGFNQIYLPCIHQLNQITNSKYISIGQNSLKIKHSPQLIYKLCLPGNLPLGLYQHLESLNPVGKQNNNKSLEQRLLMNGIGQVPKDINKWLAGVNKKSSLRMAFSNFLGNSLTANIRYILAKISKKGNK